MKRGIFILYLFLISFEIMAQEAFPLTDIESKRLYDTIEKIQKSDLYDVYAHRTGTSGNFINGRDYTLYYARSAHKPVLRSNEKRSSSISFNGRTFDNIVLQYDTYKDQVIYTDDTLIYNDKPYLVSVNKDYIDWFDLYFSDDTLTFRYFDKKNDTTFNLKNGFYEVVYDNEYSFLIRHTSSCSISNGLFEYYYSPDRYVNVEGRYSRIATKKQFVRMFGARADDIRQYIHTNRIKFHKAGKQQITRIIKFYENL